MMVQADKNVNEKNSNSEESSNVEKSGEKIKLTFSDGKVHEFQEGTTGLEIAAHQKVVDVVAILIDGQAVDLTIPLTVSGKAKLLTFKDKEGQEIFWHSACHISAMAVRNAYPEKKIHRGVGPAVENGFYQDYDMEALHPSELKKIEDEMKKIVHEKLPFVKKEVTKVEALKIFSGDPFKTEMINELEGSATTGNTVTIYSIGDYSDFCRGPHVPHTGMIRAFKLTKVAGAYWRADAKNKQLQRLYGIAFPSREELASYLKIIEEAEKRDHRRIGEELDLFSVHDEGPGFPFFHHKGSLIYDELVNFMKEKMFARNYQIIKTPIILSKELWLQSGHWDHYKENMYFTKIDNREFAVKPMNCPGGMIIYKTRVHSYRELPIKAGEFGLVHRHELSGVLSGLFRVRVFTQDDAHVFCTEEQLQDQIIELLDLVDEIYTAFDFKYRVVLSTKPEKAMGDPKLWEKAEEVLLQALKNKKLDYTIAAGDGVFYGPKIDFKIKDAIGREWQCGTIQCDFQMPERFDLSYIGEDNTKHRPVMVHRAIYGSMERFIGVMVEHFAGKFPIWLSPVQVRILTVADRFIDYAKTVEEALKKEGIRVELDTRAESVPKKVRDAQIKKIPLLLTLGEKEQEAGTVAVRTLDGKVKFGVRTEDFVTAVKTAIKERTLKMDVF